MLVRVCTVVTLKLHAAQNAILPVPWNNMMMMFPAARYVKYTKAGCLR